MSFPIRASFRAAPLLRNLLILSAAAGLQGCAVMFPPTLHSPRVAELPPIDGTMDEAWNRAKPLRREAKSNVEGDVTVPVEVRALHTGDEVAFLVRWEDPTRSDAYREYVRNAGGGFDIQGDPDDQLALKINMSGSMRSCMLAGKEYVDDIWQWRAARTNAAGYAEDRRFLVSLVPAGGTPASNQRTARNGKLVQVDWKEDEGTPLIEYREAAADGPERQPLFTNHAPTGSQADVQAGGEWRDGIWTVELRRRLDTGHADDAPVATEKKTKFALALFDRSEGESHANTRWINLKLD